jgi:hypothetical protein
MRFPFLVLLTVVAIGCGQIATTDSQERGPAPADPASATPTPAVPPEMAPPASRAPASPPRAGTCGAMLSPRAFATADDEAVALHGLWVTCTSDPAPGLCPSSDSSMFFGALDAQSDLTSRATACGHLTKHGDGFIGNPAYVFTYEVKDIAASGAPPTYALRLWNDTTDRTFALTYRDDVATAGYATDGTFELLEPDGRAGTLRHSAFTTF